MKQIKVKTPLTWNDPISVVVNGVCNHAAFEEYKDTQETVNPHGQDFVSEYMAVECERCGAVANSLDTEWQETIASIKYMNEWFERLQEGKL